MTVSDYNTNLTIIILVGIRIFTKFMFFTGIWVTVSDYNTNPTVIVLVGIGILTKCIFYSLVSG
jgi:hypothetical protein